MIARLAIIGSASLAWAAAVQSFDQTSGDPAHGKIVFAEQCALCHSAGPGAGEAGQGPDLGGLVGRKVAGDPEFPYTAALKSQKGAWSAATLDEFLKNPAAMVPGTAMPISVAAPQDRQDLIAYLATTKPLP